MNKNLPLILILFLLFSCGKSPESINELNTPKELSINIFSNDSVIEAFNLGDQRKAIEILPFLKSENPDIRKAASFQFANLQDSIWIKDLTPLLQDSNPEVRINVAWALAQNEGQNLDSVLIAALDTEKDMTVRGALWEGLGKKTGTNGVYYFQKHQPSPEEMAGYAAGLYAMIYKGVHDSTLVATAVNLMETTPDKSAEVYFGQYLGRAKEEHLSPHQNQIIQLMQAPYPDEVLVGLARSLGKIKSDRVKDFLIHELSEQRKYPLSTRMATAYLYAFREQFDRPDSGVISSFLLHPNENVALAAIANLKNSDFTPNGRISSLDSLQLNPRVLGEYLGICIKKYKPIDYINYTTELISKTSNSIHNSFLIKALSNTNTKIEMLKTGFRNTSEPALKSTYTETILNVEPLGYPEGFSMKNWVNEVLTDGDPGSIALVASHLRYSPVDYKSEFEDTSLFEKSKAKLTLPEEMEAWLEIEKTLAFLKGEDYVANDPSYNHPIDWEKVKTIHPEQQIKVKTTAGDFTIQLDVESSPGSVSALIELIEADFYDNKIFHRVVPNFVIQTGCPRGDGFGSVDFTIRSEFGLHRYTSGAVGLASAGKDTESCQWFVTHVPTPFLEGRYTIVGYITEGMEIIQEITLGDRIQDIVLMPSY